MRDKPCNESEGSEQSNDDVYDNLGFDRGNLTFNKGTDFSSDDDEESNMKVSKSTNTSPFNMAMNRDRGITVFTQSTFSPARASIAPRAFFAHG